jgi:hypothetical protein
MQTFKHSGNTGDILYSLYSITQDCIYYIHLDQPADYGGRVHPLGNVMMNKKMFDMIVPLLLHNQYIKEVKEYKGEEIDYDLDKFRTAPIDLGRGDIKHWYYQIYPELTPHIPLNPLRGINAFNFGSSYIAVNRTFRYRNPDLRYKCLNDYDIPILFMGLQEEFDDFKLRVPKAIHTPVTDFLQAAEIIRGASLFIGNQSMMFAISELLQVPRILEVYKHAPNVIPSGGQFYEVINETNLNKAIDLINI